METIILLKLEVDFERLRKEDEPDRHIQAKIRAYIADIVGDIVAKQEHVTLLSSTLAVPTNNNNILKIQPTNPVIRIPD